MEEKLMSNSKKFEEYKMFIDDTARFTERRQNASNLYVTVHTLLLAAIVFAVKDSQADQIWMLILPMPVVIAGIFVSRWWGQIILKYKELVGLRIKVLREMEESDELSGLVGMYHREDDLYPRNPDGTMKEGEGLNFSDLEVMLPKLFIVLYSVLGAILAITLAFRLLKMFIDLIYS
jgi:hypothetical protein